MPNRIIKESILASNSINSLSPEAEILFYRLMVCCDDFGIFYGSPSMIRPRCFPLKIDKVKESSIKKWMLELQSVGLIFLYEAEGKLFLKLTNWEKHQTIRAKKSKYVTPGEDCAQLKPIESNCKQMQADVHVFENVNVIDNVSKTKKKYLDCVKLFDEEYEKLVNEFGENGTNRIIEILDSYKGSSGKSYKSDYKAIHNWVIKRYNEELKEGGTEATKKRVFK